jgi:hypothetical protein
LLVTGLTSNTAYYFAVRAIDDGGNQSPLSNVASAQTALRQGFTIVSIPLTLAAPNNTADTVFGDDVGVPVFAYRWNPSGLLASDGCWEGTQSTATFPVCGALGSVQTGAAYFLFVDIGGRAVLDATGTSVSAATFEVSLELGFNLVGNPYGQEILLSAVQVKSGTGAPVPYATAVTNNWVARAVYVYDGATTQAVGIATTPPAAFKPWNGVWVQSLVSDAVLVFTAP